MRGPPAADVAPKEQELRVLTWKTVCLIDDLLKKHKTVELSPAQGGVMVATVKKEKQYAQPRLGG